MRIADVRVQPLGYKDPLHDIYRSFALVRIETNSGLTGLGEASDCFGHKNPLVIAAIVEEELRRHLLGEDPLQVRRLTHKLRGLVGRGLGYDGPVIQAISGLELALWDIAGKAREEPVYRLFGGPLRDRIPLYASGSVDFGQPPQWYVDYYQPYLDRGIRALKLRIGNSLEADLELVAGVREIVGSEVAILVDAAANYTAETAIRLARALAKYDVYLLEEPLPEKDRVAMARLVAVSPVPIAYGEHTYGVHGFRDLILSKSASIFEPDATVCGGLVECLNIGALAEAWGIPLIPHCGMLTAVGTAANLHLAALLPGLVMLEYDANPFKPQLDEFPTDAFMSLDRVENGCLRLPEGPGWGVQLDERAVARYPYSPRADYVWMPQYGTPHL